MSVVFVRLWMMVPVGAAMGIVEASRGYPFSGRIRDFGISKTNYHNGGAIQSRPLGACSNNERMSIQRQVRRTK